MIKYMPVRICTLNRWKYSICIMLGNLGLDFTLTYDQVYATMFP